MIIEIKEPFSNNKDKPQKINIGDYRLIKKGKYVFSTKSKSNYQLGIDCVIKITNINTISKNYLYGIIKYIRDDSKKIFKSNSENIIMILDEETEPFDINEI